MQDSSKGHFFINDVSFVSNTCMGQVMRDVTGMYNKVLWVAAFVMATYFLWMDITMYSYIQQWQPQSKPPPYFDPFNPLSAKLIMIDHVSHYIHHIGSEYFEEATHFSEVFPWISPNMVSFSHLVVAIIGARLLISDKLHWRQLGAVMYLLRDFLDSLDGVVYRAHAKNKICTSVWGTSGYMVDILCDIGAGFAIFTGIFTYLLRYPPLQTQQNYMRLTEEGNTSKRNGGEGRCEGRVSRRRIIFVLLVFGVRFLLSSGVWDHYVHIYSNQLESVPVSPEHAKMQAEIFHSNVSCVIWWFWRVGNASAIMQMLIVAIFIDKLWEFLVGTLYIGWAFFITLVIASQIIVMHNASRLSSVIAMAKHS